MIKPNPEAIKWITAKQSMFEYIWDMLRGDNPVWRAIDSLPEDFPEDDVDELIMIAMDKSVNINQQNLGRNLNICIDYDYLTNGKLYSKSKAYEDLANKYVVSEDTIKRQVQKFLPS